MDSHELMGYDASGWICGWKDMDIGKIMDFEEAMGEIGGIECPWPEDIWPEISPEGWKTVREALKKDGLIIDSVSGNLMRRGWNLCMENVIEKIIEITENTQND